jgi:hypothetical protein
MSKSFLDEEDEKGRPNGACNARRACAWVTVKKVTLAELEIPWHSEQGTAYDAVAAFEFVCIR